MRATVLVTDGEQRGSLAVVRSLGRAGHRVYVCAGRKKSLAGSSRYVADTAVVSSALAEPARFVGDVQGVVRRWNPDIVIPVTDPALETLLPVRDQLGRAVIPFADVESYRALSDKARTSEVAAQIGIAVPPQRRVERREELMATAEAMRFPLVLKPSQSVRLDGGHLAKLEVSHVADLSELEVRWRQLPDAAFPLLVQERIIGPGMGVFLLIWEGRTIASFSHQRIREKPPGGGLGVYQESVRLDPMLRERCEALFRTFGWRGVAMVEMKIDRRTGIPHLIEVNARFWASLQLSVDCGVDFPAMLVAAALRESPTPVHEYPLGMRTRWWWGDVDQLIARLRRSRRRLALPPNVPGRLRGLGDFLVTTLRRETDETLRLDDPRPFVRETIDWLHGR